MILDTFSLANKRALVTGASRGLGKAIAIGLAEAGADVACHGRVTDGCADAGAAIEALGRRSVTVAGDLSDKAVPERLVAETVRQLGGIDILINNAGMIRRSPAADFSGDDWDEVVEVNLSSIFHLAQAAGRHMLEQGLGKIVNIASLLSFQGGITVPAYTAAKSGVAGLTKALANEWASRGVNLTPSRPVIWRPTTPQHCELTKPEIGRSSNAFLQVDGDNPMTSPELQFSCPRPRVIT